MVPISIPPAAAVPMVRLPTAPGPVATTNGISPATKANDVIRIGRKRMAAPSMAEKSKLAKYEEENPLTEQTEPYKHDGKFED